MGLFKNELLKRLYAPLEPYDAPFVHEARILVTGAGGSIGAVICKELSRFSPVVLAMLDAYDGNLYSLSEKIGPLKPGICRYIVGSIRDRQALNAVFREIRPTIVFHVAALKHVPMLEDPLNLAEAADTNILGTYNVAIECLNSPGCIMVNVSTDKAVRPSSILGLTKRCAELYVNDLARRLNAPMASVRFGNVLDSIGSVMPLFKNQILAGGPVTLTDAGMTRYFMTLEQAAALTIMTSGLIGDNLKAQCYMLEMGKQVKITDVINALIDEYGETGRIEVSVTGIRPGEKLNEELRYPWETPSQTRVPGVYSLAGGSNEHVHTMEELRWAITERRSQLVARLMQTMVPDFSGDFSI